jgi:phosphoglycolate phosphatase
VLSEKKLIIFDFDGTIADTVEVFVQVNNDNYKDYGTKFVSQEDVEALKKMGDRQALKFLGINMLEFILITRKFFNQIHAFMHTAPIYKDMKEVLSSVHHNGKLTAIVSRNSVANIKSFLKANKIEHISAIYAETIILRKHKIIRQLLKRHKLTSEQAVFIGDRISDYVAAKKAGIDFIFVTWGYGDATKVPQNELKYIAHTPQELKKILGI